LTGLEVVPNSCSRPSVRPWLPCGPARSLRGVRDPNSSLASGLFWAGRRRSPPRMATHDHAGHDHKHGHTHQSYAGDRQTCCGHNEMESERQILIYLIGFVLLVVSRVMVFTRWEATLSAIPALVAAVVLGIPLLKASFDELRKWRASSA